MSRIQPLQNYNYASYRQNSNYNKNKKPLAFKGAAEEVTRLSKDEENVVSKVLDFFTGKIKGPIMDYASETVGEIQNLFMINIGTACIAPIFIVNNPLSHEDSKSKKYTAWRQPISAVIALAMGLSINKYAPRAVEKYLMKGSIPSLDLSLNPPSDYSQRIYKSIKKTKNFDDLFADPAQQSKKAKEAKKVFDLAMEGLQARAEKDKTEVSEIKTKEDFLREFSNKKIFSDSVSDGAASKYAKKLLDVNNPEGLCNVKLRDFLVKNLGFKKDYSDPEILNKIATRNRLEHLTAVDFARAFGFDYTQKDLHTFMGDNIYKHDSELTSADRMLVTRFVEAGTIADKRLSAKLLLITTEMREGFATNKELLGGSVQDFLELFNDKLKVKESIKTIGKERENEIAQGIKREITHPTIKQLAMGIAKNMAKDISDNYGGYGKGQGIILTLLTLPISCGVLNWAYPRVMDKCFPKLAKAKADATAAEEKKGGKA